METWKDSHSDICVQESLITGEWVDFMGICLQGTLPSHSVFSSGNLPTPECCLSLEP